jgi:hypothetical protein
MSQTVTTDAPEPREPGTGLGAAFLSLSFDSFGTSTAARSGARSMVISFSPGGVGALPAAPR